MAELVQEDDTQHSLRIGDTVLLYARERNGFVFSELTSEIHNSVALLETSSFKDPNLPNVHFASFKIVGVNKYKAQKELDKHLKSNGKDTKYFSLLKKVKHEEHENKIEQERLQGSAVIYGDKIQLLNTASRKYLAVNAGETSRTETTSLKVELCSTNSEGCIFKILPRYKVRSVGDDVRYNDQAKFESVRTEGQFLHCSSRRYRNKFPVFEQCFELNLSATESALTIVPHYRPLPSHDAKTLRGGGVVRLFHRESECYVSAEGSFALSNVDVEDVHCRKRKSHLGRLKSPSTSANVFWQFEKESDRRSGEPLLWGERCRIKHLPTRRYLAVIHDSGHYKVTLKQESISVSDSINATDLDTVFSFYPVIQEKDTILVESYARIKHLQTHTWLHLDKDTKYTRMLFEPSAPGLEGLQWDSAELFELTATETMNYDDAFTLEPVKQQLLDNFNYVAGIAPILTTHIKKYGDEHHILELDFERTQHMESALKDLAEFISSTVSERERKDKQKLLRNLKAEVIADA